MVNFDEYLLKAEAATFRLTLMCSRECRCLAKKDTVPSQLSARMVFSASKFTDCADILLELLTEKTSSSMKNNVSKALLFDNSNHLSSDIRRELDVLCSVFEKIKYIRDTRLLLHVSLMYDVIKKAKHFLKLVEAAEKFD